ncbi:hypothetical protein TNCV_5045141 [Trichonephila clavipes]|uniref:Uncharacterized protein n=1 Tax=Trichonephila clavipes TaxID=2585209 RepID=A0A8X6WHN1_TRICX|nr:hypothetical protein TNCV_5045141 [Trichonephila clavipes]
MLNGTVPSTSGMVWKFVKGKLYQFKIEEISNIQRPIQDEISRETSPGTWKGRFRCQAFEHCKAEVSNSKTNLGQANKV